MSLIKSKQIDRIISTYVRVNGVTAGGDRIQVTGEIGLALNSAGNNGTGVPVQDSTNVNTPGVIVNGTNNRVEIYDASTKKKISDADGNEIYGRIESLGGIYSLNFYVLSGGTETDYTFPTPQSIDFEFGYRFTFATLPADAILFIQARNVDNDPDGSGSARLYYELKSVTAPNVVAPLMKTPANSGEVILIVNGKTEDSLAGGAFDTVGKLITWNPATAGYSIDNTDRVVAIYSSNE